MKNSSRNGMPPESAILTDQPQAPATPEQTPIAGTYKRGVFLARKKGQSFEEFENFCVESFRKAGLIKD